MELSDNVTYASRNTSTLSMEKRTASDQIDNYMAPQALGDTVVDIATKSDCCNQVASVDVSVQGTTDISGISILEPIFDGSDVASTDPSAALCPKTFRGQPGYVAGLEAEFTYAEHDGLACPFRLPLGTLRQVERPVHDVSTLLGSLASTGPSVVSVNADQNLVLQGSSVQKIQITAALEGACTSSGDASNPGESDSTDVYANLEATDYQLDVGHRCGSPMAKLYVNGSDTAQRLLAANEESDAMQVRIVTPASNLLQSVTLAITYDADDLSVTAATCTVAAAGSKQPAYSAVNFGDTNALRYNGVWSAEGTSVSNQTVLLEFRLKVCFSLCLGPCSLRISPVPSTPVPFRCACIASRLESPVEVLANAASMRTRCLCLLW